MEALKTAIRLAGGVSKLATALGVGQSVVSNWLARGTVPDEVHCVAIERLTQGAVKCEDFRPHAPWLRVPDSTWPHPGGRPVLDVAAVSPAKEAA